MKLDKIFGGVCLILLVSCDSTHFIGRTITSSKANPKSGAESVDNTPKTEIVESPKLPANMSVLSQFDLSPDLISDPTKLVFIIDDSFSMAPYQDLLATGIKKMFQTLKDRNVEVFVYTTSALSGSSFKYVNGFNFPNGSATIGYHHDAFYAGNSKSAYLSRIMHGTLENGTTIPLPTVVLDRMDFSSFETTFVAARSAFESSSGSILFDINSNAEDKNELLLKAEKGIKVGIEGSSQESPLCAVYSLLQNQGPNKIFNQNDRTAFLILTDEDHDFNLTSADMIKGMCPYKTVTNLTYNPTRTYYPHHVESFVIMDYGVKCDDQGDSICYQQGWRQRVYDNCAEPGNLCNFEAFDCTDDHKSCRKKVPEGTYRLCNAAERADYLQWFNKNNLASIAAGLMVLDPNALCQLGDTIGHRISGVTLLSDEDLGKPFTVGPTVYPDVESYYRSQYPEKALYNADELPGGKLVDNYYVRKQSFKESTVHKYYDNFKAPTEIKDRIKKMATDLFGPDNSVFMSIGNQGESNPSGCAANPNKPSIHVNEVASVKQSICDKDYSKALAWFDRFTRFKEKRQFQLDKDSLSKIVAIRVVTSTNSLILDESMFQIDHEKGILTINGDFSTLEWDRLELLTEIITSNPEDSKTKE